MLGLAGILASLVLLVVLAYRGFTVLVLAPVLALLAVALGQEVPLLATYTQVFMTSLAGYLRAFFPLFLLGAIFGKVMDDSGSARSISRWIAGRLGPRHAILSIVLSCAVLTYGGVSVFVVAFAVYPIAAALFQDADVPKRLIPGAIAFGSFSFSMSAIPGSPQIQNSIPMPFFGTTLFAAPVLGLAAAVVMLATGHGWLTWRGRTARARGEGYGSHPEVLVDRAPAGALPSFWLALLPIATVLGVNLYLSRIYFPSVDLSFLQQEPYRTAPEAVIGLWSLIVALTAAILLTFAIHAARFVSMIKSLNEGAYGSMLAILNTASEVGYGNVIASLPAFAIIKQWILGASSNPLIAEAISVNVLAGITGSASGGLSIALGALGKTYVEMAQAANLPLEVMHRVAVIASGGLDSLPHNGAVITLLAICGLTHRESYLDIGVTTVIVPLIALVVVIVLAMAGFV